MIQEKPTAKQLKQATRDKNAIRRKMKEKAKRISEKGTKSLPIFTWVQNADSNSKTPKLKMYAITNHPTSSEWQQSLRPFESQEDLLNPEGRFIMVDELIEVLEEDFDKVALLNQTAKDTCAIERTLQKALNK